MFLKGCKVLYIKKGVCKMSRKMRGIFCLFIITAILTSLFPFSAVTYAATSWNTSSPDGSIVATIILNDNGELYYSVTKDNNIILESSKMGIKTNVADFNSGMSFVSTSISSWNNNYSLVQRKKSVYMDNCNQRELVVSKGSYQLKVYFRVYNDGIAFRYYIPGSGSAIIYNEYTRFNLPNGTGGWAYNWRNDYEGLYEYKSYTAFNTADFAMPILASINNNSYWALITEGNVYNANGSYCTSHLHGSSGQDMQIAFAPEQTSPISTTYPFQTPYRVVIITSNLDDLVKSTLVTNLNPATQMQDTSWIQPGIAAWSWWSEERSPQWYTRMKEYVDYADYMDWEYVTVDAGWDDSWIKPLCDYAASKNVKIIIWTDVDAIDTSEEINNKLTTWAGWGVKGIKVDFMMNDSQMRMNTYQMIAEKCAELELIVNFHGSTKPSGEIRTWPHVITTEGIRGTEHYKWSNTPTAYHNCVVPFTRNVIGPMDYTPVVFSNTNRNTTHAHQLALSIIYESGIQHVADSISSYEAWKGTEFLRSLPVTWDDTKLIEGFPGNYVTIARKSGNDWFIGAITDSARTATIPLSFLGPGVYTAYIYQDGSSGEYITKSQSTVTSTSTLQIPLLSTGGCAIKISQTTPPSIPSDGYVHYEAEDSRNTLTGAAAIYDCANCSGGKKAGYLGNGSGTLQFNEVYAPTAGLYTMKIYYLSGDERDVYISINGGSGIKLSPPVSGSFNVVRTEKLTVYLNQGNNTIKFYNNSGYAPDIDKIAIKDGAPSTGTSYEAENGNNTLYGAAAVYSSNKCSGGYKVGYLGNNHGAIQFNNVNANFTGTHLMRIYYLSGNNRTFKISVNSGTAKEVICFDSGSFDDVQYKEILINLNSGSNTILFYNDEGWAPDLDRIVILDSF